MSRCRTASPPIALSLALSALLAACAHAPLAAAPQTNPARAQLTAGALLDRGIALLHAGDGLRAEQYLVLAVRAGAPAARAIVPLVQACVLSSRLQSALEHALPHLRRHPEAWRLRMLVAAIQLALGRSELARRELERVQRAQPDAPAAHYLAAVIARDQLGDARAASASFAAYVRAAPRGEHAAEARAWLRERAAAEAEPTGGARR
jgi:tetratricopeptide (TPR) repeat protein